METNRRRPDEAANRVFERLGGQDEVESRIALQLSRTEALAVLDRFEEAHRYSIRALEVLDREGFQSTSARGFGPLNGLIEPAVGFVAEYIVKSYAESVSRRMRSIYARREAQAVPRSPERVMLARSRMEMDRINPGFSGGGVLAPLLLLGGITIPALAGLGNFIGAIPIGSQGFLISSMLVLFVATALLLTAVTWLILPGIVLVAT
ncbi:MAG TPA: hypothetical protein QGF35_01610 [Dehalococcoidia bacterium]|nr:hypothetical protein [Dehalococcoidia bacterium]